MVLGSCGPVAGAGSSNRGMGGGVAQPVWPAKGGGWRAGDVAPLGGAAVEPVPGSSVLEAGEGVRWAAASLLLRSLRWAALGGVCVGPSLLPGVPLAHEVP